MAALGSDVGIYIPKGGLHEALYAGVPAPYCLFRLPPKGAWV